jgi:hypothetical protein
MALNLQIHIRFFLKVVSIVFILQYIQTLAAVGLNVKVRRYTLSNKNTMHYHEQAMEDEREARRKEFWENVLRYRIERLFRIQDMFYV